MIDLKFLFLFLTVLKVCVGYPFQVIVKSGSVNGFGGTCLKVIAPDYDSKYACVNSKKFGTCLKWSDVVDATRICQNDGNFCWDLDSNSHLYVNYANKKFWVADYSGVKEKYYCKMQCDTTWNACYTLSCEETGYSC